VKKFLSDKIKHNKIWNQTKKKLRKNGLFNMQFFLSKTYTSYTTYIHELFHNGLKMLLVNILCLFLHGTSGPHHFVGEVLSKNKTIYSNSEQRALYFFMCKKIAFYFIFLA